MLVPTAFHPPRLRRLAKEGSWVVAGQIAMVAGALVLVRVVSEYLGPEEYGQLALGLTVAGLVNQLVMGGISNGIGRFYSIAAEEQDLSGYLRATGLLLAYATLTITATGLTFIVGLYWLNSSQWTGLVVAALVFSVLSGYNSALSSVQNAARQRAVVAFHGGLDAWLKILLAAGAILWLGASATAVVIGYACSSLLMIFSQLIFLRSRISSKHTHAHLSDRRRWLPQMWGYSLPFCTWGTFTWMQQASDRWALQTFASTADVGQYAVLFQLGFTPVALATGMTATLLGPILYQRAGDATDQGRTADVERIVWKTTYASILATALGVGIAFAMHDWLFSLLVASEYRGGSYLLPWVVLAGGLFAAGQMLSLKLLSEMKSSVMVKAKIISALLGLALNVFGAWAAGMQGVVAALVAFSGLYFVWMLILARTFSLKSSAT